MRNFLNKYRIILHCIIGSASGHLVATLIFSERSIRKFEFETFGDRVDYVLGFPFMIGLPVLVSALVNFCIEDYQLRARGTSLGFSYQTIGQATLAGIPAGILFIFTWDNKNDVAAIVLDSIIILAVAAYYFWDEKKRKYENK